MKRLREFRRKLEQIERRMPPGRTTVDEHFARLGGRRDASTAAALLSAVPRRLRVERREPARQDPVPLPEACPGAVVRDPAGAPAWLLHPPRDIKAGGPARLHGLLCSDLGSPDSPLRRRMARGAGIDEPRAGELLFLDIETTGLGSTPLFLIGVMAVEPGGFAVRQYLARDYSEEPAVIRLFLRELESRATLVSFNGKSFDVPYIRTRAAYHRLAWREGAAHFDVLHEARRVWRGTVPDCRLQTLESLVCGRARSDDIDGADIPDAYHEFVRTGDASRIAVIARHNVLDLLTMADIMVRMPPA